MFIEKGYSSQNVSSRRGKRAKTCSPEERDLFPGRNGRDQAGREAQARHCSVILDDERVKQRLAAAQSKRGS
jgi:hypothetical protein